jgi:hypothetical protein
MENQNNITEESQRFIRLYGEEVCLEAYRLSQLDDAGTSRTGSQFWKKFYRCSVESAGAIVRAGKELEMNK